MAIKKTELYSSLWASCDELRGGMDASQYKDYVLTILFMKYVSDKYKGHPNSIIVVPKGTSFDDMVALKGDKEIGDKINKIISALAEENELKGVIDVADFNDEDRLGKGQDMVDTLSKLIGIFEGIDLSTNRADGDDLLGDAYEYLMRHFATESGKSKGQFYTPSEVSRILSKVIGISNDTPQDATVYDPTCGSGSLLLKASDEAPRGLSIFGQEKDNATSALARMNMILHDNATAKIWKGNTISDPQWKDANGQLKTFDFAVANPPFSNKNWTNGINPEKDEYNRFIWGIPPEKNGDYTFLLHVIKSLKSTGKGAVILPHGVLFRGNAEARIRENLIKQGYIKGIIGLPTNLFYGTGIPACVIVIDKENAQARKDIFMIDASKGFIKDGNKNRLRSQDIYKIVEVFTKQTELPRYSRKVSLNEIAANDYNLNIHRYIDSSEPEDLQDLSAHLQGGIPNRDIDALELYWQVFPSIRASLFKPLKDRRGYSKALVKSSEMKNIILNHDEFRLFASDCLQHFHIWARSAALTDIAVGNQPKSLIARISESLLQSYSNVPLLSKYDIYQILMDYWDDVMQDDVYVLVQDGWFGGKEIREIFPIKKDGKKVWKEKHDFEISKKRYRAEVIPRGLVENHFFPDLLITLQHLESDLESATQELEDFVELNSGEEDLLLEAKNDKDKVTQKLINARLKELKLDSGDPDEINALEKCLFLVKREAAIKKKVKEKQAELDLAVFKQYSKLSIDEIKSLIVNDKWLATLESNIQSEIERVTQQLANRVKELEERYSEPLPDIIKSVENLSEKVESHLKAMGV